MEKLEDICIDRDDLMISFDVKSLFISVPVKEALKVVEDVLNEDKQFEEQTTSQEKHLSRYFRFVYPLQVSNFGANTMNSQTVSLWDPYVASSRLHFHVKVRGACFSHVPNPTVHLVPFRG